MDMILLDQMSWCADLKLKVYSIDYKSSISEYRLSFNMPDMQIFLCHAVGLPLPDSQLNALLSAGSVVLDGNLYHVAHGWGKIIIFGEKNQIRDCSRSNQMPQTDYKTEIASNAPILNDHLI